MLLFQALEDAVLDVADSRGGVLEMTAMDILMAIRKVNDLPFRL